MLLLMNKPMGEKFWQHMDRAVEHLINSYTEQFELVLGASSHIVMWREADVKRFVLTLFEFVYK